MCYSKQGFAQETLMASAKTAIKAGSPKALTPYFGEVVEINLDDEKSSYNRSQAEQALQNFFAKHPVESFEIVHQGTSKEGLKYAVGKYKSAGGSYRVYMLIRQSGSSYTIETLDFSLE